MTNDEFVRHFFDELLTKSDELFVNFVRFRQLSSDFVKISSKFVKIFVKIRQEIGFANEELEILQQTNDKILFKI